MREEVRLAGVPTWWRSTTLPPAGRTATLTNAQLSGLTASNITPERLKEWLDSEAGKDPAAWHGEKDIAVLQREVNDLIITIVTADIRLRSWSLFEATRITATPRNDDKPIVDLRKEAALEAGREFLENLRRKRLSNFEKIESFRKSPALGGMYIHEIKPTDPFCRDEYTGYEGILGNLKVWAWKPKAGDDYQGGVAVDVPRLRILSTETKTDEKESLVLYRLLDHAFRKQKLPAELEATNAPIGRGTELESAGLPREELFAPASESFRLR